MENNIEEELLRRILKPGITVEDLGKPFTPEQEEKLKAAIAKCRDDQRKILRRKNAPFINYLITI